jgi:hypothetical protein
MKNTTTNNDLLTISANLGQTDTAQAGDRVRSFDSDLGTEAVEGIVISVERLGNKVARYEIEVDRDWRPINDTERDAPSKIYTGDGSRVGVKVSRLVQPFRDWESGFVNLTTGGGGRIAPDAFHGFRDALGRFTAGNPGRAILSLAA